MGDEEIRILPGIEEGPEGTDERAWIVGEDEDLALDARVVAPERHSLGVQPAMVRDLADPDPGHGIKDFEGESLLAGPGLDIEVLWGGRVLKRGISTRCRNSREAWPLPGEH
jgi:hypothetical protein